MQQGFQRNLSILKRNIQNAAKTRCDLAFRRVPTNMFPTPKQPGTQLQFFESRRMFPAAKLSAADQHTERPSAPWASAAAAATGPGSTSPIPPAALGSVPDTAGNEAQRSGAVGGWATKRAAWLFFWGPHM
jgi:hypothetical protein